MAKFKGLIKQCEVCQTEFKVPQSQAHVRTCSYACGYQIRRVANKTEWVECKCVQCGILFTEVPCHALRRRFCSQKCYFEFPETVALKRATVSGDKNPGWQGGISVHAVSASGKQYSRRPLHLEIEKSVRRKRAKDGATPAWADLKKVKAIYKQAQQVSKSTGVIHHVDHQVPLTSKLVCGLHNEFNLKILPSTENLQKHNRTWPDMW